MGCVKSLASVTLQKLNGLICEKHTFKLVQECATLYQISWRKPKFHGESPNFMAKARIVSTKKAPEDVAEPEELRSWNHELHFHQNVSRPREKTSLLQATQHDFTPTTVHIF